MLSPDKKENQIPAIKFPLSKDSVQKAVYWAHPRLTLRNHREAELIKIKINHTFLFDFISGMNTLHNAFLFKKQQLSAYQSGSLFMLESVKRSVNSNNGILVLPDEKTTKRYLFDVLFNSEWNTPQIDEVKASMLKDDTDSIPKFVSAMIEMRGTRAEKILVESLELNSKLNQENMLSDEIYIKEVLENKTFVTSLGPEAGLKAGANDIYWLLQPPLPITSTAKLEGMWNIELK